MKKREKEIERKLAEFERDYPDITDDERSYYLRFLRGEESFFVFRCRVT